MSETPSPQDAPTVTGPRSAGVTAGTSPARPRPVRDEQTARASLGAPDRRGAILGLVTAGAAAVVGSAVSVHEARSGGGATAVSPTGQTVRATIRVQDMRFVPDTVEINPGDRLEVTVENTSELVHDLVLDTGAATGRIPAGGSAVLDAGVLAGATEGWCSIAGHRAQGMVFHVTAAGQAAGRTPPDGSPVSAAGEEEAAVPDYSAPPPEGFTPVDAVLPAAPDQTIHRHTFTVTEVDDVYVGAGVTQHRWTFNGGVPGPVLRGRVGDTFEITLVNEGSMSHSIDFHAGIVSPDEVMRSLNPGEQLVYTFTAEHSGIWLYHCSTAPMSVHMASGMFGAVVIDPDGLTAVDREYILIQSEMYLGPQGGETDAAKVATKNADLLAFNGVAFQYKHAPLTGRPGERIRFWVLDAGPSLSCSFHVVGLHFDTVFLEGTYMLGGPEGRGGAWHGGAQALGLQAAQGGFVEAVVPAAGHYSIVNHSFADMEKGAVGVLEVND